jgi:hypothetical protein
MGMELPLVTVVVARLVDPEINLASYGGVVFPLALIIESPIIMLLAASTALSKDWASYNLIYRFTMWTGGILTVLHAAVAFTPLFYIVVIDIIGAPAEIVEPSRWGLMIMTPWTWSIAYRRFQQGVLIRFDHSRAITKGTVIRLLSMISVLLGGYLLGSISGIVVATVGIVVGVILEAIYIGFRVHPVVQKKLKKEPKISPALNFKRFIKFYTPLAMTSLLTLIALPIGSAAISRMPNDIESLAAWTALNGLIFMLGSTGLAYQEIVVTLLDRTQAYANLRKFAIILSSALTGILLLIAVTPLSTLVTETIFGLDPTLAALTITSLLIGTLRPALMVTQHWFQGIILHSQRTAAITEAIAISVSVTVLILIAGVVTQAFTGIYVAIFAFSIGNLIQVLWLWLRSRKASHDVHNRDNLALGPDSVGLHTD